MSLSLCVRARGLEGQLRAGLQALGAHSAKVTFVSGTRASHSIALDEALEDEHPQAARWDYGIGLARGRQQCLAWVEVHPATSGEVDLVLRKLAWLKGWLATQPDACRTTPSAFYWVATGSGVHIDLARRRKLNAAGLRMPQSQLRL